MEFVSCKETVMKIIEEASEVFGSKYYVSDGAYKKVDRVCDLVDEFALYANTDLIEVAADERYHRLSICIDCDEIVLYGSRPNALFALVKAVNCFNFSKHTEDGEEYVRVELNFDWVWKKHE